MVLERISSPLTILEEEVGGTQDQDPNPINNNSGVMRLIMVAE